MNMDFKTFDIETSKIRVAYRSTMPYFSLNTNAKGQELKRVHGLHFPNSKELLNMWDMLSKDDDKITRTTSNIIYMDSSVLLPPYFVKNLEKDINAEGIGLGDCFGKTNWYLHSVLEDASYNKPKGAITSEDLTKAVGMAFEELGRLRSDIRIVALSKNPVDTVIQNLTMAKVGYFGEILVQKKSGNDDYTGFY